MLARITLNGPVVFTVLVIWCQLRPLLCDIESLICDTGWEVLHDAIPHFVCGVTNLLHIVHLAKSAQMDSNHIDQGPGG
jgi:hypothetical protein